MSIQFTYKYGQGHIIDEELFAIETMSFHTHFLKNKPPGRCFNPAIHLWFGQRRKFLQ